MNKSYVLVNTKELVQEMARHILENDLIAFDTETTSLNPRKGEIIGWSVSAQIGKGYYLPTKLFENNELIDHIIDSTSTYFISQKMISMLVGKKLIMHNASFDCRFTKNYYEVSLLEDLWVDTALLVHTVQEEGAERRRRRASLSDRPDARARTGGGCSRTAREGSGSASPIRRREFPKA